MGKKKYIKINHDKNAIVYKYPPIYKYGFLLLTIYMLMKHQKIMTPDKLLTNSIIITLIIGIVDYAIIDNHPYPFFDGKNESFDNDTTSENRSDFYDDFDEDFDYDAIDDDYDLSIEKDIESLNNETRKNNVQINYLKNIPQGGQLHGPVQFQQRQYYSTDMIG